MTCSLIFIDSNGNKYYGAAGYLAFLKNFPRSKAEASNYYEKYENDNQYSAISFQSGVFFVPC